MVVEHLCHGSGNAACIGAAVIVVRTIVVIGFPLVPSALQQGCNAGVLIERNLGNVDSRVTVQIAQLIGISLQLGAHVFGYVVVVERALVGIAEDRRCAVVAAHHHEACRSPTLNT